MATSEANGNNIQAVLIQIYGEDINKRYPLNDTVVRIGRALNAHVRVNALSVSRNHCILKKEPEGWILEDCGSQNGTYVNGRRMQGNETYSLQFGDLIFLGPPSDYPIAFCFEDILDKAERTWVKMQPLDSEESEISSPELISHSSVDSQAQNTAVLQVTQEDSNKNLMLNKDRVPNTSHQKHNIPSSSKNNTLNKVHNSVKRQKNTSTIISISNFESSEFRKGIDRSFQPIVNNQEEAEDSQSLLDVESDVMLGVDAYSSSQGLSNLVSSVPHENISKKNENCESAKVQNSEISSEDLKSRLVVLSKEIEKLEKSKSDLLKEYEAAQEKNKLLDQQLTEQKKFSEDMHMYEQRLKNQFKDQIMGQLEEDLICNICTELLIRPTVLDCSHTFCEYCIKEWKKKKRQCPVCRSSIQKETRVLVLDHFIDKTLETLTPEQKDTRRQLILQREQKTIANLTPIRKRRQRRRSAYARRRSRPLANPANDLIRVMFSLAPIPTPSFRNNEISPVVGNSNANEVNEIVLSDDNSSADEMDF